MSFGGPSVARAQVNYLLQMSEDATMGIASCRVEPPAPVLFRDNDRGGEHGRGV